MPGAIVAKSPGPVRRFAALGAVALVLATAVTWLNPVSAGAAVRPGDVVMTVTDVTPNSPALSHTPEPMQFSLTLVNTTDKTFADIVVSAERSDPIITQAGLNAAIAKPKPPSSDLAAPLKTTLRATLAPHATMDLFFRSSTDIPTDADICLCADAIYPIYFTATYTPPGGPPTQVAVAQTYLPSFKDQPAKMPVSWVWPLLDRPHRLFQLRVFRDDALAAEIAPGGRLDQLLQVAEDVGSAVPMTLVTDPDLIDELYVMQTGYRVRSGKTTVTGTGSADAAAWLARLRGVLADDKMELTFTAPSDPAVESLTRAGVAWSTSIDTAAQARISKALGTALRPSDISWPAASTINRPALSKLVEQGTKTVIVSDTTLPKGSTQTIIPNALAQLQTSSGPVLAAVTSTPIERWVTRVLKPGGPGLADLPKLVAQLAMRAVTSLRVGHNAPHYVVITPPRDLTVDPQVAERAILATAATPWSTPLPLRLATTTIATAGHGQLHDRVQAPALPDSTVSGLQYIAHSLPGLRSLYGENATGATAWNLALGDVPVAAQRCTSSSLLTQPSLANDCTKLVAGKVTAVRNAVYVAKPTGGGQYTIASKNSRLPITVVNHLPAEVHVRVSIDTVNGVPGFSAPDVDRTIDPNSTVQLRIPTHVNRVGRIDVQATLSTPDGISLGHTVPLTVHSTALGTVGVVITIVAAVVLLVALLVRLIGRLRSRRRPGPRPPEARPAAVASASS